jgi:hypothetical protein
MTKKATGKKPITNLGVFIREVDRITTEWSPRRLSYPWFRGHGDTTWPLVPGLYRSMYHAKLNEDNYREEFKLRAFPYLANTAREPNTEWEWYFLMQHHGLPTRLLDWTRSALIALYFSVRDATGKNNAAVWVLDPWALNNKIARKGDNVFLPGEKRIRNYLTEPFSRVAIPRCPIALDAPLNSKRITAQKGVFTLHGNARKALDRYAGLKPRLLKIEIAKQRISLIREQLLVVGISETTVFPELTGLCRELLDYWKFQSSDLR